MWITETTYCSSALAAVRRDLGPFGEERRGDDGGRREKSEALRKMALAGGRDNIYISDRDFDTMGLGSAMIGVLGKFNRYILSSEPPPRRQEEALPSQSASPARLAATLLVSATGCESHRRDRARRRAAAFTTLCRWQWRLSTGVASDDDYDVISNPGCRSLDSSIADLSQGQLLSEPEPLQSALDKFDTNRTVRVYVDGTFDWLGTRQVHQLRQAKLSFSSVFLVVGVFSDELCQTHRTAVAMPHVERCEILRHCRWVDQVLPDAPWQLDAKYLHRHRVDYVGLEEGTSVDPLCDNVRLKGYDEMKRLGPSSPPSVHEYDFENYNDWGDTHGTSYPIADHHTPPPSYRTEYYRSPSQPEAAKDIKPFGDPIVEPLVDDDQGERAAQNDLLEPPASTPSHWRFRSVTVVSELSNISGFLGICPPRARLV
ncbi:choline-phosphate cytidylyltransferase [Salix suchowensis]|nr:choline-phosphate cytidylyltransferase [Salix suchowensis]